jgi:hypothetical protein
MISNLIWVPNARGERLLSGIDGFVGDRHRPGTEC